MRPPAFTVITPTYNRADLLQRCIKSMLDQTFSDWQYIVIDDGSTDDTSVVMQTFIKDPRIKYIQKENTGAADSRNVAVRSALGKMVTFLDSDDEALPDWLFVVSKLIDSDVGIVSVGAVRCFNNEKQIKELPYAIKMYGSVLHAKLNAGTLFFRRELYIAIGGFDVAIRSGMQTEFGIRLLKLTAERNKKILSADQCLVKFHDHHGPKMRNDWNELTNDTQLMINKLYRYYYENDKQQLANNFAVLAYYHHKANHKLKALKNVIAAIRLQPFRFSNYLRAVKYSLNS